MAKTVQGRSPSRVTLTLTLRIFKSFDADWKKYVAPGGRSIPFAQRRKILNALVFVGALERMAPKGQSKRYYYRKHQCEVLS